MKQTNGYLICLEGGGTRSQVVLMNRTGEVLQIAQSSDVNTNFVRYEQAQKTVQEIVGKVLEEANLHGNQIDLCISALVGPRFGSETFGKLMPRVTYSYYPERDVIFARAGIYKPHGVAVVAATGATAWGIRQDDNRNSSCGGWGSLLGDEGSAYALGLSGLRAAIRSFEGRIDIPSGLVDSVCKHFQIDPVHFQTKLINLAYQKPLSRAEIAGFAKTVTDLATKGDQLALQLTTRAANDLAGLALHVAQKLFDPDEKFDLVVGGGLINAGDMFVNPFIKAFTSKYPKVNFLFGTQEPAIALGRLVLYDIEHLRSNNAD